MHSLVRARARMVLPRRTWHAGQSLGNVTEDALCVVMGHDGVGTRGGLADASFWTSTGPIRIMRSFSTAADDDDDVEDSVKSRIGRVTRVLSDMVYMEGLQDAYPFGLVTFDNGSKALVVDVAPNEDGEIVVAMVGGPAVSTSNVAMFDGSPVAVETGPELRGRVVDVLGNPLDDAGSVKGSKRSIMSVTVPSAVQRASRPVPRAIPSSFKLIDAFHPLAMGQSCAFVGERGLGKTDLALSIVSLQAKVNRLRAKKGDTGAPMVCVYVAIGKSSMAINEAVNVMRDSGAMDHVVVVSADGSTPVGARYLAPFTGAAIAEYWRDHGAHALVVYDDLTAHQIAAQTVSRARGWGATHAAPTMHGALFDRCAIMAPSLGGGSLSAIALAQMPPSGDADFERIEFIKQREATTQMASLCDDIIKFSSGAMRHGYGTSIDVDQSIVRARSSLAQGRALRYYSRRAMHLLSQVREVAHRAKTSLEYGIDPEADTDRALELHAKLQMMFVPTSSMIRDAAAVQRVHEGASIGLGVSPGTKQEASPADAHAASPSGESSERRAKLQSKMNPEQLAVLEMMKKKHTKSSGRSHTTPRSTAGGRDTAISGGRVASVASSRDAAGSSAGHETLRASRASPEQLLAGLFAATHGYLRHVPLAEVHRYERELTLFLLQLPAPLATIEEDKHPRAGFLGTGESTTSLLSAALASNEPGPAPHRVSLNQFTRSSSRGQPDPGEDETTLDPVWALMHVAVDSFTDDFVASL